MQAQSIGMAQTALTIGLPTIAVMIGILVNNSRLGDLNGRFGDLNGRIIDLNGRIGDLNGRIIDMNGRVVDLNGRITALEHHVDARFEDLKATWRAELRRVEEVLDARLRHLEERS